MIVNTLDKKYVMVYTGNNSNYPNQLLSVCEYNPVSCACTVINNVSYDAAGKPLLYRGNNLSWDIRRLTGYGSNSFSYDSEGNRIGKNSIKYVYEDGKLRLEDRQDQNSNYKFNYIYGVDGIIGFYTDDLSRNENNEAIEEYYFYQKNQQGDVVELIRYSPAREDVQLEATYVYDAWGNHKVLNPDGTENTNPSFIGNINPIRYRSYYYDVETGLYYLKTRYYDPRVCRFISQDDTDYLDPSMISGMNLYAYCLNNPVMYSDPSGNFVISSFLISIAIGFAIGAVIGGGFEVAKQVNANGWNAGEWDWGQIGLSTLGGGISGAISSISPGSGFISYLRAFLLGGLASVSGGLISGSVNSLESVALAFCIGGIANVVGKGMSDIVKHIKVSKQINILSSKAQKIANMSAKKKSLKIWSMIGEDNFSRNSFKSWGYDQIFGLLKTEATNQMKIAATKNLMRYTVYSSVVSSLGSGWY